MATTVWGQARALLDGADVPALVAWIGGLDRSTRQDVARELPGYLRAARDPADRGRALALLVAGAGVFDDPEEAADWLARPELRPWSAVPGHADLTGPVAAVTASRPPEWRTEVAHRAAERLRATDLTWQDASLWHLAAALAGDTPPLGDGFVVNWVVWGGRPERLADDPFLDALLPRMFRVEGLGRRLVWDKPGDDRQASWADAVLGLTRSGRLDRGTVLDLCLERFQLGGRPQDLYWFVRLHDALEPTPDETAARLRAYVLLLADAPAPVAAAAFQRVRRIDEAGRLDVEPFAEAAGHLLARPERKLAGAALTWADRSARKRDRVDATLLALTAPFGSPALRDRAAKAAAKHLALASQETRRLVRDAAVVLPAELRERLTAPEPEPPAPPAPPAYRPRPLPPPLTTPAEAVALHLSGDRSWPAAERLMAALVELSFRAPDRLREAFVRALPGAGRPGTITATLNMGTPEEWVTCAVRAVLSPAHRQDGLAPLMRFHRKAAWYERSDDEPVPHRFLIWRMREIVSTIGRSPVLLATPTESGGHLDPSVLVRRLERLAAAGVEPGPADLVQALLRLPRGAAAPTSHLTSRAARAVRAWMAAGGLPDPEVTVTLTEADRPVPLLPAGAPTGERDGPRRPHRGGPPDSLTATVTLPTAVPPDMERLCSIQHDELWPRPPASFFGPHDWWPAVLPSHREIAAAHLLPHLVRWGEGDHGQGATLRGLAGADGPAGPATATALVFGLGSRSPEVRRGAVRALLVLSARNQPPPDLGTALATLVVHDQVVLGRVTDALAEVAAEGAHAHVWAAVRDALPHLLPVPGRRAPSGLTALLTLAVRTVEATGATGSLPELDALVARRGANRLTAEATRLHRALTLRTVPLDIRVS
ncbi:hypothetical protein HNR61_003908 [Actinomadura namibiensis]|uniref:DUF6493 domain-containing protein n=2 Tax=Actinomadura TaxID=1988 RepID=A0A7W3LQ88_ACTNM|nr:DUF6493 family protein [Actinomadura namibiensis]MBA8952268.1 hypothetical protein [Actinomadura namibiensis]